MGSASRMTEGAGRGGWRRVFLGTAGVLVLCITACQVHYYRERRTPEVRGVVLDAENGKPVAGADVGVTVFGFPSNPLAGMASPPRWALAGEMLTTTSDGTFILPSRCPSPESTGVSWLSYLLWGPMQKRSIGILVYAPEYIPLISEADGFDWTTDPWVAAASAGSKSVVKVTRTGSLKAGFRYTLHMRRAVTRKDWESKCALTKQVASSHGEPYQTWLFNDLTGYLERWPQGEKAGEYYALLWETAAYRSCDYMRQDLANGQLSRKELEVYSERGSKILALARGLNPISVGMDEESFRRDLAQHEESLQCAKMLLEERQPSLQGGAK